MEVSCAGIDELQGLLPLHLKAIPRVWVDMTLGEVVRALGAALFTPWRAAGASRVAVFERAFAEFVGVAGAVAFPNCRSALFHSLKALDLQDGDEVILPAYNFWIDPQAVLLAGLRPVFVDVDLVTHNLDPELLRAAITPRTRAIMPVHLNGLPADMERIMAVAREHGLRVIEDCARSCGAKVADRRVGAFDIGAFSFGYGKSFYGLGGGMVTSDDTAFLDRLRALKQDFSTVSYGGLLKIVLKGCVLKFADSPLLHRFTLFPFAHRYQVKGDRRFAGWFEIRRPELDCVPDPFRVEMFNVQAELGLRQIGRVDRRIDTRRAHFESLNRSLDGVEGVELPGETEGQRHICVHYAVASDRKDALQRWLLDCGIDAQDESAEDVTAMARFRQYARGPYRVASRLQGRVVYLPTPPALGARDMERVGKAVAEFFSP